MNIDSREKNIFKENCIYSPPPLGPCHREAINASLILAVATPLVTLSQHP